MAIITINTFDQKKGHYVKAGSYDEEARTFNKSTKDIHIMRVAGISIGIQEDVMDRLHALKCTDVMLHHENGITYHSRFAQWQVLRPADYGHGKQRFLSLSHMEEVQPAV